MTDEMEEMKIWEKVVAYLILIALGFCVVYVLFEDDSVKGTKYKPANIKEYFDYQHRFYKGMPVDEIYPFLHAKGWGERDARIVDNYDSDGYVIWIFPNEVGFTFRYWGLVDMSRANCW